MLGCFFLVAVSVSGQVVSSPKHTDRKQVLHWDEKPDVHKWLIENGSMLKQGDGCTLSVSWADKDDHNRPSSAVHEITSFVITPQDEEMTRLFSDTASPSGLGVRVGVRYLPSSFAGSEQYLQIALALEGAADEVFDEISRSEAGTIRYKNWKDIEVVKPILIESIQYRFALSCENGKTFLSFLRHSKHRLN